MKRIALFLSICLGIIGLLTDCKDTSQEFSPGAGDQRLVGTWQLAERRFPADSVSEDKSYNYGFIIVDKQQVKITLDSTVTRRYWPIDNTLYYQIEAGNTLIFDKKKELLEVVQGQQTLSFSADGKLTAEGNEMSYYNPIKYYRVDSTYQEGLGVNLYISTNRANQYFRQGIAFDGDMLVLKPKCEGNCYLKFSRVR
ncbi:hypothetical protein GCM10028806_48710 [Spirosoma terrae]|uniref:Lipocalin-like domain-containing protein n=1 Tax=Spirosoma terrae TaxID=1968276 RepID=A0A6L9L208_9BACT|nr:hypothetical protein [Spirosoma terrae]NDU93467.1 hypothetical protein [Spirosoma terrae]